MKDFFLKIWAYLGRIFYTSSFVELKVLDILVVIVLTCLAFYIIKYIFKGLHKIFVGIHQGAVNMSAKNKCSHIQCRHCGRSLDRCTCNENRNKSYNYRLRHYKKETKNL